MTVTREELMAYADGQLEGAEAERVAAAIAFDPALAAEVEAHRSLRGRLGAHFAPIIEEPVPDRLRELLTNDAATAGSSAEVVDFAAAAAARRKPVAAPPARSWVRWGGPAIAATLLIGFLVMRPGASGGNQADGALADALDTQLAASQPADAPVRVLVSFANGKGELCRSYTSADQSGIACRDAQGWRIERKLPGTARSTGDYQQAGSAMEELMASVQDMAQGEPLDAAGETAAKARGWRR